MNIIVHTADARDAAFHALLAAAQNEAMRRRVRIRSDAASRRIVLLARPWERTLMRLWRKRREVEDRLGIPRGWSSAHSGPHAVRRLHRREQRLLARFGKLCARELGL